MPRIDFHHEIHCEAQHVHQAAQVVLHTILFHRLLGTIRPACVDAFGMTFPAISDAEVDTLIRQRASQLAAASASSVSLVVYFLHPSTVVKATPSEPTEQAPASSLRAWASPRSYQYGWLAHAFSSGAGQASGAFIPPKVADEGRREEEEAFEKWSVTFNVRVKEKVEMKSELGRFVGEVLEWVGENKAHLPAISAAGLCPYPFRIAVLANP